MHFNGQYSPPREIFDFTENDPPPIQDTAPASSVLPEKSTGAVRLSVTRNENTPGHHRLRIYISDEALQKLTCGLVDPRVHVDGDVINGLRLYCRERGQEKGGLTPVRPNRTSMPNVTVPIKRARGREQMVRVTDVPHTWSRDDHGPVLLVERVPDIFLPESVIARLPRNKLEPETALALAFKSAENRLKAAASQLVEHDTETAISDIGTVEAEPETQPEPVPEIPAEPVPEPVKAVPDAADADMLSRNLIDLRDALDLVNELVDQLGDDVVLQVNAGRVQAMRRVVQFVEL